tara:strand:- start:187 stop:312 length:126 start_codon:yes stop_codon:yes gene_type:complete
MAWSSAMTPGDIVVPEGERLALVFANLDIRGEVHDGVDVLV